MRYHGELTTDGYIPWKLFLLLYSKLSAVSALTALNQVRAVNIALAGAFGDEQVARRIRELVKEAEGCG